MFKKIFLLVLSLTAFKVFATIYIEEKDGMTSFSDTPGKNAEPVNLKNVNTVTGTKSAPANTSSAEKPAPAETVQLQPFYSAFKMLTPKDQETFQNQPEIPVKIQVEPELSEGDKIQILLDDQPYGEPSSATDFKLSILERGTHTISANLINKQGKVIRKTKKITVYVKRHSKLLGPTSSP